MTDKHLNNDQLEEVSGGSHLTDYLKYKNKTTRKLGREELESNIGNYIFLERTDGNSSGYMWIYAQLNGVLESEKGCNKTVINILVTVQDSGGSQKHSGGIYLKFTEWDVYI